MILLNNDAEVAQWYAAKVGIPYAAYHGAIGLLDRDGYLKGAFLLTLNNPHSGFVDMYSEIPNLAPYARPVFSWLFTHANRITATCAVGNKHMQKHLPRLGFEFEGRKKHWFGEGKDALEFRMTATQCKWINHGPNARHAVAA